MSNYRVQPIDGYPGETLVPLNAWLKESDRIIWSNVAQCMRVAGSEVQDIQHLRDKIGNASLRSRLAYAEGEIAKARAMAAFLVEPDTRKRARKAINRMAACVRAERGV